MAWGTADYSSTGGGDKLNEWSTNEGGLGAPNLVEQKTFVIAHSMNGYAIMNRAFMRKIRATLCMPSLVSRPLPAF